MIDTASGWSDLATYTDTQLLAHLDSLRQRMAEADRHSRIVEVRTFELRIAEATRALAIVNRRATEAQDQQVGGVLQADVDALLAVLRAKDMPNAHALVARMWTALQVAQPALIADEVRAVVREVAMGAIDTARSSPSVLETIDAIADRVADKLAGRAMDRATDAEIEFLRAQLETASTVAKRAVDAKENLELQREADLREAILHGAHFAQDRAVITDSGCGPSIDWVDEGRIEEEAARYARSKAGL